MTEWISVKKELPKSAGFYLVVADWMGVIEKAEFNGCSSWLIRNHVFEVTHWMPLPEPPND
jgi:ferritin